MTLFITLSTDNILVVENENIAKFYNQFATGADFIQVIALNFEDWEAHKKVKTLDLEDEVYNMYRAVPSIYVVNTKHIVMFNDKTD